MPIIKVKEKEVIIDDDVFLEISEMKIMITLSGKKKYKTFPYCYISINKKIVALHRYVMNCPNGLVVDHLNHNTLDNRRSNLRVVTYGENLRNNRHRGEEMYLISAEEQGKGKRIRYRVQYHISGDSKQKKKSFYDLPSAISFRNSVLSEHYNFS